jgi:hypothetical protein|tara:strand:+ start:1414 stop:2061 length:648 start_codon:yes stop_codon:yes gene_type:complete
LAATKIEASNIAAGAVPSTGFTSVQVFTAVSTWTKPTDITKVIVEVQAAGGGSGAEAANNAGGSGGGGAYALKVLDVTNVATCTVTVGAAAAAATYSGTQAGGTGGTSSFAYTSGTASFTTVSAIGGNGGGYNNYIGGGVTAAPTTGDINMAGQAAQTVKDAGNSKWGFGGRQMNEGADAGRTGAGYGSGANGAYATNTDGNVAQPGIVIVWEYK